jgi:hypothetical protein
MRPLWMNFPADVHSQENDRWVVAGRPGTAALQSPIFQQLHAAFACALQPLLQVTPLDGRPAIPLLATPLLPLATPQTTPLRCAGSSW